MLKELLRFDSLGTEKELNFVLFKALVPGQKQRVADFLRFCNSNMFSIGRSLRGILCLLDFISFIDLNEEYFISNTTHFNPSDFSSTEDYFKEAHFFQHILASLFKEEEKLVFFTEEMLKLNHIDEQFYLKDSLIEIEFFPIRNLLIGLNFLERRKDKPGDLYINKRFQKIFKELIVDSLQKRAITKKISLSRLKSSLARKEQVGEEAELFVLEFEKKRLDSHPFKHKIVKISTDHVNAGYDIMSFNELDSYLHDRFIEVKSFKDELSFYWSKNEIFRAKELSDKYFLYLVDRSKMTTLGYSPKIFQNPYRKIFESELWRKETENWKIWFDIED